MTERTAAPVTPAEAAAEEPTVGTGSVFAVGCSIASLALILAGIGLFVLLRLL